RPMRRLGLRERLLLFYTLTALIPMMLSGGLLYTYLNGQVARSTREFQGGVQQALRRARDDLRAGVAAGVQESHTAVKRQMQGQLHAYRETLLQEQTRLLRQAMGELQTRTRHALQRAEHETQLSLDNALQEVEQSVQATHAQSLAALQTATKEATQLAIQDLIGQHSAQLAAQLSRQVEGLMRNYTAQLTLIAQQPAIQNANLQEARWILQSLQDREPAYQMLTLLDKRGETLLEVSDALSEPSTVATERATLWMRLVEEQDTILGEAQLYRVEGRLQPLVPLITPIRQRGAELQGAIFALVSLDELNALVRGYRLGARGSVALIQQNRLILAHTDRTRVGQTETRLPDTFQTPNTAQSLRVALNDGEYLVTIAPVRTLRAMLFIAQPADEAFQLVSALHQSLEEHFNRQQAQIRDEMRQSRAAAQARFERQWRRQREMTQQQIEQAQQRAVALATETLTQQTRAQQRGFLEALASSARATQTDLEQRLGALLINAFHKANERLTSVADDLRASINDRVREEFGVAMTCMLTFLLIGAAFLHKTLVRPLRLLVKATHDIATGDLTRRVQLPSRGCPDLDDLADSFNHMVDALQKAETQLIQSSKLASLGTLASGVAHELNQPLAIIRAIAQQNLETLRELPTPQLIQQLHEDLTIIHRQTVRMSQIIQHLRVFSRKPREEYEPVNLSEVAQNALILMREQLRQRGVTLAEHYADDLPAVLGEANSLEQIVINLLTNARDALEGQENGEIHIETARHDDGKRAYAELRIRDNGPGVPPDIRSQIFDPFFTTKDPNKGTGLGLAISLEIAQKHGGTLILGDSEQGAEFILRIPVAQAQKQAA
ncbi:MAG: ATP-binding protein, partial [Fimbriimonadales bacterium]